LSANAKQWSKNANKKSSTPEPKEVSCPITGCTHKSKFRKDSTLSHHLRSKAHPLLELRNLKESGWTWKNLTFCPGCSHVFMSKHIERHVEKCRVKSAQIPTNLLMAGMRVNASVHNIDALPKTQLLGFLKLLDAYPEAHKVTMTMSDLRIPSMALCPMYLECLDFLLSIVVQSFTAKQPEDFVPRACKLYNLFPALIGANLNRGGAKGERKTKTKGRGVYTAQKNRMQLLIRGRLPEALAYAGIYPISVDAMPTQPRSKRKYSPVLTADGDLTDETQRRVKSKVKCGLLSQAAACLGSKGVSPLNDDTRAEAESKFPARKEVNENILKKIIELSGFEDHVRKVLQALLEHFMPKKTPPSQPDEQESPPSQATENEMMSQQPPENRSTDISPDDIEMAIGGMKKGKARDPHGWKHEHYKMVIAHGSPEVSMSQTSIKQHLSRIAMLARRKGSIVLQSLCPVSALTLLNKTDKPAIDKTTGNSKKHPDIRPIQTGGIIGKLIAKCDVAKSMSLVKKILGDLQLGCASNGTEHVVKTMQLVFESEIKTFAAEVDHENAFNEMVRRITKSLFDILERLIHEVLHTDPLHPTSFQGLQNQLYELIALGMDENGKISGLKMGDGGPQGNPALPTLFSVTMLPFLLLIKKLHSQSLVKCFFDDSNMSTDNEEDLAHTVWDYTEICESLLIPFNNDKYKVNCNKRDHVFQKHLWTKPKPQLIDHLMALPSDAAECEAEIAQWTWRENRWRNKEGWSTSVSFNFPTDGKKIEDFGRTVLGVPIGSREYVIKTLATSLANMKKSGFDLVTKVNHAQSMLLLTRYCLVTKPMYLRRNVPCDLAIKAFKDYDSARKYVLRILLRQPSVLLDQIRQAQLPTGHGGVGLVSSEHTCKPAFAASTVDFILNLKANSMPKFLLNAITRERMPLDSFTLDSTPDAQLGVVQLGIKYTNNCLLSIPAIEALGTEESEAPLESHFHKSLEYFSQYWHGQDLTHVLQLAESISQYDKDSIWLQRLRKKQSILTSKVLAPEFISLLNGDMHKSNNATYAMNISDVKQKAILRCIATPESGKFLHAFPMDPRSEFSNDEFHVAMGMRFLTPIHAGSLTGKYCCDKPRQVGVYNHIDRSGLHLLTCLRGKGKENPVSHRHNCMRDKIAGMLKFAGCNTVRIEPQAPTTDGRRLDIGASDLVKDVQIMVDFTVAAPFADSYVNQAAKKTGYAADQAIKRKIATYEAACQKQKVRFIPLAMETHGYMSPSILSFVSLAQAKVKRGSSPLAAYHSRNFGTYWRIRLSVEFMKATAESILERTASILDTSKPEYSSDEIFSFFNYPGAAASFIPFVTQAV
jgi:hypothetical protein